MWLQKGVVHINWRDKKRRRFLVETRKDRGITQESMARRMKMCRSTYLNKENEFKFTIQELDRIAEILKTTTKQLIAED